MPRKKRTDQTKIARRVGWTAILSSLLVLPLFGLLMPSSAAENEAQGQNTEAPQLPFDLPLADPNVLETAPGVSIPDASGGDADNVSGESSDDLVTVSDGSVVPASAISRDNGRVADSSPNGPASRPAQNAVAMIGDYPIKRVLQIDGPFEHGDWVWNEDAAPGQGKLLISVNLDDQILSVYRGGVEIGTAVILYGADEKPTPTGQFKITEKDIDHVSNLYFAPMPYMLRLTNDGIAIHGSEVEFGYATHGCIGIPDAFAKQLFRIAKLGDQVVITG